jgi:TRAP-type C4-dicarboxylate transport system permease small subunit
VKDRVFWVGLRLANLTENIAAVLLIAVIVMNLAQVIFRYVIVDPLSWSEETMRYSTTWMVLLAGSSALFRGEHMAISLFDNVRSERLRLFVRQLVFVCIALFCVLLMWEGFPAAIQNARQVSPATRIPMVIPYLAIPVGAALMLIKVLCLMVLPEDVFMKEEQEENRP